MKRLFLIAGEASGDLHGASLMKALTNIDPSLSFYGWGGNTMISSGLQCLKHIDKLSFMGFVEVVKHLPEILSNFTLIKKQILAINPDLVILIDYPGFNMRLGPWLRKNKFKTIYYIAPQLWAWHRSRAKKLKSFVDFLYVILPFEPDFFNQYQISNAYFGNPLKDSIDFVADLDSNNKQIALLPGSRAQEIRANLPLFIDFAIRNPEYNYTIAGLSAHFNLYDSFELPKHIKFVFDNSIDVLKEARLALVASGSATLQTALLGIPQIVCYKTNWFNYQLAKRLIYIPFIALVNVIMNKEVVPELIQDDFNLVSLQRHFDALLTPQKTQEVRQEYLKLREILGENSVSKAIAHDLYHKFII
ncbi:MAG: lipid-A-disaccharide synthase [Chitinophagales bacterium]|nr:lipid-A-disaccharide synthase [Chitinophagales bacterium]